MRRKKPSKYRKWLVKSRLLLRAQLLPLWGGAYGDGWSKGSQKAFTSEKEKLDRLVSLVSKLAGKKANYYMSSDLRYVHISMHTFTTSRYIQSPREIPSGIQIYRLGYMY